MFPPCHIPLRVPAVPWALLPSVTIPLSLSFCLFLLKSYEEWIVKSVRQNAVLPPEQSQRAAGVFSDGDKIKACGFHPEVGFNLTVGDPFHRTAQTGTPEALPGGGSSRGRRILLMGLRGSDDEVKSLQPCYSELSRKSSWEEQEQRPNLCMTKIHLRIWCYGLVARVGALKG